MGEDLNLGSILRAMTNSPEAWNAALLFAREVMYTKAKDEMERHQNRQNTRLS